MVSESLNAGAEDNPKERPTLSWGAHVLFLLVKWNPKFTRDSHADRASPHV